MLFAGLRSVPESRGTLCYSGDQVRVGCDIGVKGQGQRAGRAGQAERAVRTVGALSRRSAWAVLRRRAPVSLWKKP